MTIDTLDRALKAQPFRPFAFRLADGRTLSVPHPEFVAYNPKGRIAVVMDERDGAEFVDLLLVVSLPFEGEPARSIEGEKGSGGTVISLSRQERFLTPFSAP